MSSSTTAVFSTCSSSSSLSATSTSTSSPSHSFVCLSGTPPFKSHVGRRTKPVCALCAPTAAWVRQGPTVSNLQPCCYSLPAPLFFSVAPSHDGDVRGYDVLRPFKRSSPFDLCTSPVELLSHKNPLPKLPVARLLQVQGLGLTFARLWNTRVWHHHLLQIFHLLILTTVPLVLVVIQHLLTDEKYKYHALANPPFLNLPRFPFFLLLSY